MPGIVGFTDKTKENALSIIEQMVQSINHNGNCRIDRHTNRDAGVYMGRVSIGAFNAIAQPVHDDNSRCWILFHGELYNNESKFSDPVYILKKYLELGDDCIPLLNGIFHFVIFDTRTNQLKLVSDKLGLQPLYYAILDTGIIFGAEIKALLKDECLRKKPDTESMADFFCSGQILGTKTLFRDVKLLDPGSILSYNLNDKIFNISQYWKLDDIFTQRGNYDPGVSIDDITQLLFEAIKSRGSDIEHLALSLSGGLDSRGILAGLGDDARGIYTTTLGTSGCADERLAQRLSDIAQTRHSFFSLNQEYLENYDEMTRQMIWLSDGLYHPVESTEMLALQSFKDIPANILLRGHGGEIAKAAQAYPVAVNEQALSCSNGEEILSYIQNAVKSKIRNISPEKLFSKEMFTMIRESENFSIKNSCGHVSNELTPEDVSLYYYLKEFVRREVVDSLNIFRSEVEIRLPYLDENFLKLLLKVPLRYRNHGEIHVNLIRKCSPKMLKVANSNTGAPLDAGKLQSIFMDKFNSLMKRAGVKGYKHYTEYQKWYRNHFKDNVRKIISSEKLGQRNLYNTKELTRLFELHISGKQNYGNLFALVIGLELWFQEFVD